MATKNVLLSETFGDYVTDFNGLGSDVGDLTLLTTSTKASLVAATNSLKTRIDNADSNIGTRSSLTTSDKTSLVAATNSLKTRIDNADSNIGTRSSLLTSVKTSLVAAINEIALAGVDSSTVISIARTSVSVTDAGGDGSLSYSSATGVITYTGPSASEVRAKISVTDAGGDGSLSYDNSTGVLTYTGPSASEVRAHLSAGARLSYSSGQFNVVDAGIDSAALGSLSVSTAKVQNGAITSGKLASAVTLIIYNSAGSALKTLYGAGS